MIDKTLLARYWKDFYIVTQEERDDFPYANVADAAKMLIKGRNWSGTFTELLITNSVEMNICKKSIRGFEAQVRIEDRKLLAMDFNPPGYVLKNSELLRNFVWQKLDNTQRMNYAQLSMSISEQQDKIDELTADKENIELILKKLEKSTDWIKDYINWQKFELRGLQQ